MSKKILIIDDDAEYRQLMGEVLSLEGWSVLEAADGETGLEAVSRERPDVVLCDLLMPRSNGFLVCRKIRSDFTLRHTKIVVASGQDYDSDRLAAREAGADEYLTKPIKPYDLLALIARLTDDTTIMAPPEVIPPTAPPQPAWLKFWGVRGSVPTPGPGTVRYGGNTTCVEVRAQNQIVILDGGTGLRPLGRSLLAEFQDQPLHITILLTHTHWDHIQGLPFFTPIYHPRCRVRILGFEGARRGLVNVLTGQMESPYFPVPFGELPGNIEVDELKDLEFPVGNLRVRTWFANHPGICVGYRIHTGNELIVFFPDNEPHCRYDEAGQPQPTRAEASLDYARSQESKMIEFLHGADVAILDAQYDRPEYEKHVGWGHGCVDDVVMLAVRAQVKRLFLFHHDPDHDDNRLDELLARARQIVTREKSPLAVALATEGQIVRFAPALQPA
ncbi:MAG TPA: response regulator [Verrucomicrobiota bacterium]|nr:response regulator [Verrucomicrobiota bacterium]